jgi:hypothetical protein
MDLMLTEKKRLDGRGDGFCKGASGALFYSTPRVSEWLNQSKTTRGKVCSESRTIHEKNNDMAHIHNLESARVFRG